MLMMFSQKLSQLLSQKQFEDEWKAGGDEAVPSHSQEQDRDAGLDHSGRVDNTQAYQGEIDEDQSGKNVEDSNSDLEIPVAEWS